MNSSRSHRAERIQRLKEVTNKPFRVRLSVQIYDSKRRAYYYVPDSNYFVDLKTKRELSALLNRLERIGANHD